MLWTSPLALFGIGLIVLPIAVHLLVRHQVRTLPYPSLRFLRETQLAAFRRHRLEDLALLICRCAIVALAAIALAGPVLQTDARNARQSTRISRAVVTVGTVPSEVSTRLVDDAFASTIVDRTTVADGLRDALRWLDAQPRSAREIVIAGDLRRGRLAATDVAGVPVDVGLRFEQAARDLPGEVPLTVLARRNDTLVRIERAVRLLPDSTGVVEGASSPVANDLVTILASRTDVALAEASLRAALEAGVPWQDFGKSQVIVWEGADPETVRARTSGGEVVRMPVPSPPSGAADAVRAALTRAGGVEWIEPIAITRAELDAWSRPSGAPSPNAPVADEGDRRWLWALVLVLLGVEWWLRRAPAGSADVRSAQEARVA
jgi:hypothetical protein